VGFSVLICLPHLFIYECMFAFRTELLLLGLSNLLKDGFAFRDLTQIINSRSSSEDQENAGFRREPGSFNKLVECLKARIRNEDLDCEKDAGHINASHGNTRGRGGSSKVLFGQAATKTGNTKVFREDAPVTKKRGSLGLRLRSKKDGYFGPSKDIECSRFSANLSTQITLTPVLEGSAPMQQLHKILKVVKPGDLNQGADVSIPFPQYKDLEVLAAWRVENPVIQEEFSREKERMGKADVRLDPDKKADWRAITRYDIPGSEALDQLVNEKYLLHGSKPQFVPKILCEGLTRGGGLFGPGVYLSDYVEKIDQYTTHKGETIPAAAADAFSSLSPALSKAHGDVFYGFVVRTLLGETLKGTCIYCRNCTGKSCRTCKEDMWETRDGLRLGRVTPSGKQNKKKANKEPPAVVLSNSSDDGMHYRVSLWDRAFHSLYVKSNARSCIRRFSEMMVPLGSNQLQIEYVFAYQRCKGNQSHCHSLSYKQEKTPGKLQVVPGKSSVGGRDSLGKIGSIHEANLIGNIHEALHGKQNPSRRDPDKVFYSFSGGPR